MVFRGFPVEAIEFYEHLEADNSKAFWLENKHRFVQYVKTPMLELTEALDDFGPFHMFRPNNDLRFAKNKPPYKTAQGAFGESEGGAGHYVQFSARGLLGGAGYYSMAKDQLQRFRDAVVVDATGEEIVGLVADYGEQIVSVVSDTVKRWDTQTVSERLEHAVGRDLQFIRVNGTLVGGLVGLTLHGLVSLF